ncbi:MAG: hypothetical protein WEA99_05080 [Brumimicrobium sp.]
MRWFFIGLIFFTLTTAQSQEKFLEVTIEPKNQKGESLKRFKTIIMTTEDIAFEIKSNRKKSTFYLPSGEFYKLKVVKAGYYKSHLEIDLTEVPESIENERSETLELQLKLNSSSEKQSVNLRKYKFEPRYGKVIRLVDEE